MDCLPRWDGAGFSKEGLPYRQHRENRQLREAMGGTDHQICPAFPFGEKVAVLDRFTK
jgi:hypothetical protein